MIEAVTAVLTDLGLLRTGQRPRYHIGLTKGDTLWFHAFVDERTFYHVKAAEVVNLDDEVRGYHRAWATYGDVMPRPLGYRHFEGWHFFVTEGVTYRPIGRRNLLAASGLRSPVRAINGFFEIAGRAKVAAPQTQTVVSLLETLEQRFHGAPYASALVPWKDGPARRELEALGSLPQHGDFVLNNLGRTNRGLVVFDWEDFGKICLPGFDLGTLVVSSFDLEVADWRGLANGVGAAGRLSAIVEPACKALGMELTQFWRCFPLYLLAFLYLKDDYATDVRRRIESCLLRVCGTHGP